MKTFSAFVVEAKDPNEYDKEGEMAENQLRTIIDAAEDLIDLLEDDDNLPEWAQNKITKAVDYLDSVRDYMVSDAEGEEDDDEEEDDLEESVEEALSPSYQNKYIGMPDADLRRKRNSFLDQINDLVKFKKKSRRDPEVVDLQDKIRKIDYATSHKKESVELDEAMGKLNAKGEIEMTAKNYAKVHKDYKTKMQGVPYAMQIDPKTGGTALYPVKIIKESVELDEAFSAEFDK